MDFSYFDRQARRPYRRPATPPQTPCLHCRRPVLSRPRRRLCKRCYDDPAVRHRYPYTGTLACLNGGVSDRPPGGPLGGGSDRMRSDNTSGIRGVHYARDKQRWVAEAHIRGKKVLYARFRTKEEAIAARKAWENATLPFILGPAGGA